MEDTGRDSKLFGCERKEADGGQSSSKYNTISTEKSTQ